MSGDRYRKTINLYKEPHIKQVDKGLEKAEIVLGDEKMTRKTAHIFGTYAQVADLLNDSRVQETREAIAEDHDCDPSDVSLKTAVKVACGAYMGYQQTSDWQLENSEKSGDRARVGGNSS